MTKDKELSSVGGEKELRIFPSDISLDENYEGEKIYVNNNEIR